MRPIQYTLTGRAPTAEAVAMLEDWITETGCVPRTLRLDGAKESVGSEMRDFCRKHNIIRESSLCTDGSHGDQAMAGTYVGADDSTSSIHVHSKLTKRSCFQMGKHFQTIFLFRDPDLLFDKEHLLSKRCQAHTLERRCGRKGFYHSQHSIALICHSAIRSRFNCYQQKSARWGCAPPPHTRT